MLSTVGNIVKNMIYAALDLGTNAFRLLIVDISKNNILKRESIIVGLGSYISKDKILLPPKKYYDALDRIFKIVKKFKVKKVDAVGTSIFRDSSNKKQIKDEFYNRYKHKLKIISPENEAILTSKGALESVQFKNKNYVVIDIGGGSTEISLISNGDLIDFVSLKLGVVREFNEYGIIENFSLSSQRIIFKKIKDKFIKYNFFKNLRGKDFKLIANGGTPTTLAAIKLNMRTYNPNLVNGQALSLGYIKDIHKLLMIMNTNERLKLAGMEKGREVVIIYGIFILLSVLRVLKKRIVYVADSGVLEGLVKETN